MRVLLLPFFYPAVSVYPSITSAPLILAMILAQANSVFGFDFITTRGSSARRGLSLSYFLLGVRLSKTRENNSGSFENISLNSRLNLDEAVDCSLIPAPWHTIVGSLG